MPAKVAAQTYERLMTPVNVPACFSFGDCYGLAIMIVLGPGIVLVAVLALFLALCPLLMVMVYGRCRLTAPLKLVQRDRGFALFCVLVWGCALPLMLLAMLWAMLTYSLTALLSLPAAILRPTRTAKSVQALWPYCGLPGAYTADDKDARSPADVLAKRHGRVWAFSDLVTAYIGVVHRQQLGETLLGVALMVALIPPYKLLLVNPAIHDLEPYFINQMSDPIDADGDGDTDMEDRALAFNAMATNVSNTLLTDVKREIIDAWPFAGHHQWPPQQRASRTVMGVQMGMSGKCTLLSHTTIPAGVVGHTPRSETAERAILCVRLQMWNPWYQLAGYVEVNTRKDGGMEHPMWLVLDPRSRLDMMQARSINMLFVRLGINFAAYLSEMPEWKGPKRRPWRERLV